MNTKKQNILQMGPHHQINARKDEDGLVAPPGRVSQPGSQQRGEVAGALKQVELQAGGEQGDYSRLACTGKQAGAQQQGEVAGALEEVQL